MLSARTGESPFGSHVEASALTGRVTRAHFEVVVVEQVVLASFTV